MFETKPTEQALKGLGVGDDTEGSKTCSWWTAERAVEETYDFDLPAKDLNGMPDVDIKSMEFPNRSKVLQSVKL